jgi:RNA polymerase sigma-70 factor (ECF subfamily)
MRENMLKETAYRAEARIIAKQELVQVYEQHSPGLFRYAYRLLGNKDLAEECVSETFSRYLHALRNGGGPNENTQAYLYRVAHNYITDNYRRQPPPSLSLEEDLHADEGANPAHLAAQNLENERVRRALMQLPSDQRRVVMLRVFDDWSHEDVSTALGKTVESTRALQHRALAALRRLLMEDED